MEKVIYAIEYNNEICFDYDNKCFAAYLLLYEANRKRHFMFNNYRKFFKCHFQDFKIVKYKQVNNETENK